MNINEKNIILREYLPEFQIEGEDADALISDEGVFQWSELKKDQYRNLVPEKQASEKKESFVNEIRSRFETLRTQGQVDVLSAIIFVKYDELIAQIDILGETEPFYRNFHEFVDNCKLPGHTSNEVREKLSFWMEGGTVYRCGSHSLDVCHSTENFVSTLDFFFRRQIRILQFAYDLANNFGEYRSLATDKLGLRTSEMQIFDILNPGKMQKLLGVDLPTKTLYYVLYQVSRKNPPVSGALGYDFLDVIFYQPLYGPSLVAKAQKLDRNDFANEARYRKDKEGMAKRIKPRDIGYLVDAMITTVLHCLEIRNSGEAVLLNDFDQFLKNVSAKWFREGGVRRTSEKAQAINGAPLPLSLKEARSLKEGIESPKESRQAPDIQRRLLIANALSLDATFSDDGEGTLLDTIEGSYKDVLSNYSLDHKLLNMLDRLLLDTLEKHFKKDCVFLAAIRKKRLAEKAGATQNENEPCVYDMFAEYFYAEKGEHLDESPLWALYQQQGGKKNAQDFRKKIVEIKDDFITLRDNADRKFLITGQRELIALMEGIDQAEILGQE
jgi:hypothetical protein